MCDVASSECFRQALDGALPANCSHCLRDCTTVVYTTSVQAKPHGLDQEMLCQSRDGNEEFVLLRERVRRAFEQRPEGSKSGSCQKFVRENLALVSVYVGPTMATRITTWPRMEFVHELANLGEPNKEMYMLSFLIYFPPKVALSLSSPA